MKQYLVKQNPNENKVVAGPYVKLTLKTINGQPAANRGSSSGSVLLGYEASIQIPIDLLEYSVKLATGLTDSPIFFSDPVLDEEFGVNVVAFIPNGRRIPDEALLIAYETVMFRGLPAAQPVPAPHKESVEPKLSKKERKRGRKG